MEDAQTKITMIYKTMHRTIKIEQPDPHCKLGVQAVPAPLVAPIMLLLL